MNEPMCEACGIATRNRVKAACGHICFICLACVQDTPNMKWDECPSCQEHIDTINVRHYFDDQ